ncbi:MAG: macro domain-containing protein [Bacteroidia bacterium]
MFNLILTDPKEELCVKWEQAFAQFPEVKIVNGYFEEIEKFDCMVSAANSFGLMDGGVDLAIIRFFGPELEKRVQRVIIEEYFGEQPVGTSFVIPVNNPQNQFVAHTPTMRVPMPINGTDNVYLAMKAMLEAVNRYNKENASSPIQSVVCPGLGTATGRMPFIEAARQMSLAYKNFINPIDELNWQVAQSRHFEITYGGKMGYNFGRENN